MALKYQEIINKLSLREKVSLLSGKNFWETKDIAHAGIPSIFLADGPHGIRKQSSSADNLGLNESLKATCFPTASALASSWNLDLAKRVGIALGKEARFQDVNVLLGPGMNTKRNAICGRNFEYFSEDPYLAGKVAANLVKGIQESGVSACVKHFCANSQEYRRMSADSIIDERALRELYLTNFEIAIKEGQPKAIMSSYNKLNGEYTNENKHLNDILRNEWKYGGVVVTDWGGENDRVEGLKVGNELEMPGNDGDTNNDVFEAIENGKLSVDVLDANLDRLLDLIFSTQKVDGVDYKIDLDKHNDLAREAEEESIVLLKNDGTLPLKEKEKIAVIGRFACTTRYQGAGSSKVNAYKVEDILSTIKSNDKLDFVGYAPGFNFSGKPSKSLIKKAIKLAGGTDTIILCLGLDELSEAEGLDRKDLKIPHNQIELFEELRKLNKNIVVILCGGSALELGCFDYANSLVHYHLGGQSVANAIVNVLIGKVNPSGKLSETYPIAYEDEPSFNYYRKHENTAEYRESIFVGYRYFDKAKVEVKYPFGFGLSYTKFEYSNLVVDESGASFNIKNIGNVEGKEVAQMYIGLPNSLLYRPEKELKGFIKVSLKPGESKNVKIPFDDYSFRVFNSKTNKWEVESGEYLIKIGSSSRDILLESVYSVAGNLKEAPLDKNKILSYFDGNITNVDNDQFKTILGRDIPDGDDRFDGKKKRITVGWQTTVAQLKYARGWSGRFFFGVINFAINLLNAFGNKATANTLIMGVYHLPMRGMTRMTGGGIHWSQMEGLIMAFNGKFFKGIHKFFKEGRRIKKLKKQGNW